jgi:hypothetical protein
MKFLLLYALEYEAGWVYILEYKGIRLSFQFPIYLNFWITKHRYKIDFLVRKPIQVFVNRYWTDEQPF